MKKILVTGGMGFVGNHLVKTLLEADMEVMVLDKSIYKPTYHDIAAATIVEGDMLSRELVYQCLSEVDTCFHLAAISSVALCNRDWIFSHLNNVNTFNNLLESIKLLNRPIKLVYASSSAVYGNSLSLPLKETLTIKPTSTYGADKFTNEMYAEVMSHVHGVHSIGLRLFNIYGSGQLASNPYSGVITNFKAAISQNKPITIFGDGTQTRDFIHVEDIVRAFITAAHTDYAKTGIYNICNGIAISINELAHLLMNAMNKEVSVNHAGPRAGDLLHSLGNPHLAGEELKFFAQVDMATGINRYINETSFF